MKKKNIQTDCESCMYFDYDEMLDELDETRIIRTSDIVELKEFIKSNFNENLSEYNILQRRMGQMQKFLK